MYFPLKAYHILGRTLGVDSELSHQAVGGSVAVATVDSLAVRDAVLPRFLD